MRIANTFITIAAIAGVIYLTTQPGGRLVPLAVFCFVFSLLGFYYGFIRKDVNFLYHRSRILASAFIFLMMALGLAYWSKQEQESIDVVAKWITPYPEIDKFMVVPRVSDEYQWAWLAESPDSPKKVINFYLDNNNTRNWQVKRYGQMFFFSKDGYRLVLMIRNKGKGSELLYKLSKE